MAEPAELLQQARYRLDMAQEEHGAVRVAQFAIALDCVVRYLEQRHAAASGAAKTPEQLRVASTLQQYTSGPDDGEAQRELSKIAGQFESGAIDLDALQELCDAATPGPWEYADDASQVLFGAGVHGGVVCEFPDPAADATEHDASFIAAARDALPKLIARVRELEDPTLIAAARRNTICFDCNAKRQGTICGDCRSPLVEREDGVFHVR